ncbi:recombinase family protein [Gammaproteobacteria bacterium]|nr:recombinase family protein [Gammaproteobacteria bacterium]
MNSTSHSSVVPLPSLVIIVLNTKYSPYQSYPHDRVKKLKSEGLGYRRIANKLKEEGLKTMRGKVFVGASIHSILKKKGIRDGRINHKFEKKISAF